MSEIFKDRSAAGAHLARALAAYASPRTLVLGLPRGGIPVAYEVAMRLHLPLDTVVARKIGAPFNPEFGLGAIAPGDVIILDNASIHALGLRREELDPIIAAEMQEMERRMEHYKSGIYGRDNPADTVLLVDDGLATGVTARAAIESVKLLEKPRHVIFAAPVCARESAELLRNIADAVVCLEEIEDIVAIGSWYEDFTQTPDEEVIRCLEDANRPRPARVI